ncbi:unnamed protein product [Blepharisma stoltei]|uniref:Uncharacterized protein n=1 Tax=Blepharisma stoltei TaxID=1481888 RepID=A0AAU9IMJ4_9CILI|nr:unnamed protein product [Blepharisma stoltei]
MLADRLHKQLIASSQRQPTVKDSYGVHFEYHDLCARLLALQNTLESPNQKENQKSKTNKIPNLIGLEFITAVPTEIKSDRVRYIHDGNLFNANFLKPKKQKLILRNSSGSIRNLSQIHISGSSTERRTIFDRVKSVYGKQKSVGVHKKPENLKIAPLNLNRVPSLPSNASSGRKTSLMKKTKSKALFIRKI